MCMDGTAIVSYCPNFAALHTWINNKFNLQNQFDVL